MCIKGYIYKISTPLSKNIYIGKTIQSVQVRWNEHINASYNPNHKDYNLAFHRAIRKYGKDNFVIEIIEQVDVEKLDDREKYWIEYYNSYYNGYNETLGGDGQNKYDYDEIADFYLNNNYSILETCIHFGIYDQVVYNALKNNGIDYKNLKNKKEKKKYNKKILLIEKNLVFERITQIDNYLGKKKAHGNIRRCLNGITKTAYGYHWKELEEGEEDGKNIYHE